jgi:hypothetical protein
MFTMFTTDDSDLNRLQNNCNTAFISLYNNPFNKISMIEDVSLTTTEKAIEHKLGQKPKGYIVIKKEYSVAGPVDISYVSVNANIEHLFIKLKATAACTVSLLIF